MAAGETCLDVDQVMALVEGHGSATLAARALAHLDDCPHCHALVAMAGEGAAPSSLPSTIAMGPRPTARLPAREGRIDRYEIEGLLGAGGMGYVYRARHVHLGRLVALKLVRPGRRMGERDVARFQREATILGSIDDPHVVRVYDYGVHEGTPFLAMELLEGRSLHELVSGPPLAPARAMSIAEQILAGLAAVHRAGIVHRDIKPSNVFVVSHPDGTETIKLLDFGVSKVLDETGV